MGKKVRNYINNPDLTAAIVQYQKECRKAVREKREQPTMPKYIGECIHSLCHKLTRGAAAAPGRGVSRFDFGGYTYHDEMIDDAIERCVYAVHKFNAKKSSSAFGYLTMVAINAKKKRIKDEKKQHAILHKNFQTLSLFNEHLMEGHVPNDVSYKVVSDYENSKFVKKHLTNQRIPSRMKKKAKTK